MRITSLSVSFSLLISTVACGSVVDVADSPSSTGMSSAESSTGGHAPVGTTGPQAPATTVEPTSTTTGENSTGTPTGDEESSSGDCLFQCDPTDTHGDGLCDIWEQDCPDGEKCVPWANDGGSVWNALRCVPVVPDADALGESCTVEQSGVSGIDTCAFGTMCWGVDADTLTGRCVGLCMGNENAPTCAAPDSTCILTGEAILAICLPNCDPLSETPCPENEGCYPYDSGFTCVPDASGDSGGVFENCEYTNACDAGLLCASPTAVGACEQGASGCCTPYCALSAPQCPDPTTCIPYFDDGEAPPQHEDLGLCASQAP